jgi:hypothetical protein
MEAILTEYARETYSDIEKYNSESNNKILFSNTISIIEMIEKNNLIGSVYKKTPYRKFLVSEQIYMFYKIGVSNIYIVLFWNNKRNPLDLDVILSS